MWGGGRDRVMVKHSLFVMVQLTTNIDRLQIISQVAELQLMKEQAEEAGVGVLMGYNKVRNLVGIETICHLSCVCALVVPFLTNTSINIYRC